MVHIGQQIKSRVEQKGMSKAELSRRLNMSSTNVHKIFKRQSIDTGLLEKLGEVLDYNFFQFYTSGAGTLSDPLIPYLSSTQVEQLRKENEELRKEINYLKEINQLLREKQ